MNNDDKAKGTEAAVQDNDEQRIEGASNTLPAGELVKTGKQLVSSLRCLPSNEDANVFGDLRDNCTGRTVDFTESAKSFLGKMNAHN